MIKAIKTTDPKEAYKEYLAAHTNGKHQCCDVLSSHDHSQTHGNVFQRIETLLRRINPFTQT
jgi:hypothetical protein